VGGSLLRGEQGKCRVNSKKTNPFIVDRIMALKKRIEGKGGQAKNCKKIEHRGRVKGIAQRGALIWATLLKCIGIKKGGQSCPEGRKKNNPITGPRYRTPSWGAQDDFYSGIKRQATRRRLGTFRLEYDEVIRGEGT